MALAGVVASFFCVCAACFPCRAGGGSVQQRDMLWRNACEHSEGKKSPAAYQQRKTGTGLIKSLKTNCAALIRHTPPPSSSISGLMTTHRLNVTCRSASNQLLAYDSHYLHLSRRVSGAQLGLRGREGLLSEGVVRGGAGALLDQFCRLLY